MKSSIAFVILTLNEEKNLEACLESIKSVASEIFVVDSFSTDRTKEIAEKFGAQFLENEFKNQADQFNWALDNISVKSDWIFRIDADEHLTPELQKEIEHRLDSTPTDIGGFYIKRKVHFMGQWIRYGGYYPIWFLRLFRRGAGRSEERKMDEHIILLQGKPSKLGNDFVDDNKKDLSSWIQKHNNYSAREAEEAILGNEGIGRKRAIYYMFPLFLRALFYFIYRYFLRLGFLDGKRGLIFHFLHSFWYRFLVDAKIYETKIKIH